MRRAKIASRAIRHSMWVTIGEASIRVWRDPRSGKDRLRSALKRPGFVPYAARGVANVALPVL